MNTLITETERATIKALNAIKADYRNAITKLGLSPYLAMHLALENSPVYNHGVESIGAKYSNTEVFYLNRGYPYDHTVLAFYSRDSKRVTFRLGNWGDLVETGRYE